MDDTKSFAARLRELSRAASPGPWRAERMTVGTCLAVRCWHGHDSHELFATRLVRGRHKDQMYGDDWEHCGVAGEGHSGPSSKYTIVDARLIVALRNHADRLADLVERVEAYRALVGEAVLPTTTTDKGIAIYAAKSAMLAALDALGGAE